MFFWRDGLFPQVHKKGSARSPNKKYKKSGQKNYKYLLDIRNVAFLHQFIFTKRIENTKSKSLVNPCSHVFKNGDFKFESREIPRFPKNTNHVPAELYQGQRLAVCQQFSYWKFSSRLQLNSFTRQKGQIESSFVKA